MNETAQDARYTMGRTQSETDRLIRQSRLYEDITVRMLVEGGLGDGMRVLDIGSGAGDVSLAAASLVGAQGEVVGVDLNGQILETARGRAEKMGLNNVRFIAGDARTLDLEGRFDALIGRLVLMYMGEPAEALRELAAHVRPGGLVAFQEVEFTPYMAISRPDTPLMNDLSNWVLSVFQRSGAHTGMGLDLHWAFTEAGLPAPTMRFVAPVGGAADWDGYEFVTEGLRSLLPLIEEYGIATAAEVGIDTLAQRLRDEVRDSKRPAVLPPHVTAWARLPE